LAKKKKERASVIITRIQGRGTGPRSLLGPHDGNSREEGCTGDERNRCLKSGGLKQDPAAFMEERELKEKEVRLGNLSPL